MECALCEREITTGAYSLCLKCKRVLCPEVTCNNDGVCSKEKSCMEARRYTSEMQARRLKTERERCGNCAAPAIRDNGQLFCTTYCEGSVPAL